MTEPVSDSRLALYEGLISLAWVDERLDPAEKIVLEDIFAHHHGLTDEQRAALTRDITTPMRLADIWPRLTDPQDRARFLDMADVIFKSDGEVDDSEADIYAVKLAKHLGTFDVDGIKRELDDLRTELTDADKKEAEACREYAKNFGLFAFAKKLIGRGTDREDRTGTEL